ncbi:MAG: alpha-ketoglutarate-dependent dioxygenase AlkB [Putridiphycobacter sp.]|nr:alpha-ketoglutarate-dependent dioxygenase AlkB [Putridiphycobacter sp.]
MLNLFNQDSQQNILPFQGDVRYFGPIFKHEEANAFLQLLLKNIPWQNDEAYIFGKHIITKRKVAWFGDEPYNYTYSNATKTALKWTPELLKIKTKIELLSGNQFNSCLLNLYHDGNEGVAWHSDAEKALVQNGCIASASFGAQRKFSFKHKSSKDKIDVFLENGSLLIMQGETQTHWLHRLPPTKKVKTPRINLTFRQYQA